MRVVLVVQHFLQRSTIMHEKFYISASKIIGEDKTYNNSYILVKDGKISKIVDKPTQDFKILKFHDATIIPGLIDLHIHGRESCDVMDGEINSIHTISSSLAKHGVTGFLATTVTSTWEKTLKALNIIGQSYNSNMPGAKVLGGYSEGLFFTKDHKGAHDDQFFIKITRKKVDEMISASQSTLKVIAIAPEIENAINVIQHLTNQKVKVMLGHTNATYQETVDAINAGASGGVHVFNGMRGIHHREPGCTGAVLTKNCSVEVIADGVHLHPAILEMIYKLKPNKKINLISDCINAGGMPDGNYKLGELNVGVKNGIAKTKEGSLAGSTLTMERAVRNMTNLADIDFREAVHMASLSPACFLDIEDTKGSIKEGKDADLCILGEDDQVLATIIEGKIVYMKNKNK